MRLIGGVIAARTLPSVREIEREYRLDRDTWTFWTKPIPGRENWVKKANANFVSEPAGRPTAQGYVILHVSGQRCMVHRLIWKVATGRDPSGVIDHINGVRDDNRIENLRDVTPAVNAANAIRDRWNAEKRARRAKVIADRERARADKRRRRDEREHEIYLRLKAKYELSDASEIDG